MDYVVSWLQRPIYYLPFLCCSPCMDACNTRGNIVLSSSVLRAKFSNPSLVPLARKLV